MRKVFKVGFLNEVDSYMKSNLKYGILEPRGRKKTLCAILSKFPSLIPLDIMLDIFCKLHLSLHSARFHVKNIVTFEYKHSHLIQNLKLSNLSYHQNIIHMNCNKNTR